MIGAMRNEVEFLEQELERCKKKMEEQVKGREEMNEKYFNLQREINQIQLEKNCWEEKMAHENQKNNKFRSEMERQVKMKMEIIK